MNLIALDIGGSKIEAILWQNGKILAWQKIKTPRSRKKFISAIFAITESVRADFKVYGIGVSLAGAIDQNKGVVVNSPNLRFLEGLNLQKIIARKFRVPARVRNDAQCFLLGEINFGQAKGKRNVIGMIIGTGVGGATYMNGQLLSGAHGFAGEQGMTTLISPSFTKEGVRGSSGREFFTVEDLISRHGFLRLGIRDPLVVQNRAFAGDKKAIALYNTIGKYLGIHLANLIELYDPELIVMGGGITKAGNILLKPALKEMGRHLVFPKKYWPKIRISRLKNAGLLGAVSLFLNFPSS